MDKEEKPKAESSTKPSNFNALMELEDEATRAQASAPSSGDTGDGGKTEDAGSRAKRSIFSVPPRLLKSGHPKYRRDRNGVLRKVLQ